MATPYRLPSGKWGIRVYSHTDADGKAHQKRITADTKREVTALAREYEYERTRLASGDLTVSEAILKYIEKKRPLASPSTITGYETIYRVEFSPDPPLFLREEKARAKRSVRIGSIRLSALDSDKIQEWINDLSQIASPKRVKNVYGLFISAVKDAEPNISISVTLPQAVRPDLRVPTSEEVRLLLSLTDGTPMHTAISLAAFCSLRAGEIAALRRSDVVGDKLTVKRSMVRSGRAESLTWALKEPKTTESKRIVPVPPFLAAEIAAGPERVVDLNPTQISNAYLKLVIRAGIEHTRFHDLRHYYASFHHAAGTPDQYIMEWGGWSSDRTLKEIYRNTLADERERITQRMNVLFADVVTG